PGEVIAIIPTADRSKATVKVRVALKVKDKRIVPDMGVRVSFLGAKPAAPAAETPGVLVPAGAVRAERDGKSVVFVVAGDGKVDRRPVTVGRQVGSEHQVLSGLKAGERVVLSPPDSLGDGDSVKPAEGA